MKKTLSLFLALLMLGSTLASCGKTEPSPSETEAVETKESETDSPDTNPPATDVAETNAPETEETIPETPYPIDKLTINGADISEYVITTNGSESSTVAYAASELQKYIELSTGVTLPVQTEGVAEGTKRILIDDTLIVNNDSIFRHFTDENGLVIAGDSVRGAMYSVYHFLEEKLNWRFFSSDTEVCYEASRIDLADIDYTYEHQYKIRDIFFYDYRDPVISVKRYLNGDSRDLSNYGGSINYTPLGIHNFSYLTNTGHGSSPNPCLNTAGNRKLMLKNIKEYLAEHPDTKVIQISQNDTDQRCTCDKCKEDDEYYGSPAGSIVELMNYLAEKLTPDYPDLLIVTFAYRYSIYAPENIVCHPNVVIEFTPIDLCRQHAITYGECNTDDNEYPGSVHPNFMTDNRVLMEEIEKWSKICDKFYMYDYGLNCRYYYTPFPDFDTLWENYRVFNSIGAMGYINLSNPHRPSAEFGELRAYLTLKLMEEPGMTKEEYDNHINEFLAAFYGDGWQIIREYFDFVHDLADKNGRCFCGFNSPEQMFGDHAFAPYNDQLVEWFDKAEEMAGTETQLLHVRRLRISMDFVRIGSIHKSVMDSGDEAKIAAMTAEVEALYNDAKALGVDYLSENGLLPEITDFTVNPREWGKIPPHVQLYEE